MASDLRKEEKPAVVPWASLRERLKKTMTSKFGRPFRHLFCLNKANDEISKHFRDDIELHAACKFLHDAGEIVRFEDAALRDLIFVDSVWLSDSLYSVMSLK